MQAVLLQMCVGAAPVMVVPAPAPLLEAASARAQDQVPSAWQRGGDGGAMVAASALASVEKPTPLAQSLDAGVGAVGGAGRASVACDARAGRSG